MNVVFDTNVIISAIFWEGESRDCLLLWAKRRFHLAITIPVFEEYSEVARRVAARIRKVNPDPWLAWIESKAKVYEPLPLGKQRSRDQKDHPFLACALASGAPFLVSKDRDLLTLERPFGIQILSPGQFLGKLK